MRILLPTMRDSGQIGGTGTHIAMLTCGLEEIGNDVRVVYAGAKIPRPLLKAGLIWPAGVLNRLRLGWGMMYSAKMRGRLLASATARELDREFTGASSGAEEGVHVGPWEVLNAQEAYSVPYLRKVADKHGLPLVLTMHGYPLYESTSEGYSSGSRMGRHYLMRAEMRALRLADAVVTVDTGLRRHVMGLVPERAESVHTLMNFIDSSALAPSTDEGEAQRLRRELRTAWDVPEDKTVLLCPRRLVKKNGVIYPSLALAAMERDDRRRFLLLYAGEGGERAEIERIIREDHLDNNVRLLGGQGPDAIRELYHLADIVLVPSVHSENVEEATSLSALEAMAAGRPLIAGNVGGLAEMVVDGDTGLLVSIDAVALARAILRLANSPELSARLGAAARSYVAEHHSHLQAAAAYEEIYRRAADLVGVPAPKGAAPSPPWPSVSVLGFPLDVVTLEQAAWWTVAAAEGARVPTGRMAIAISFNPELVMRAQDDPAVAAVLRAADLSYPDGVGAAWAAGRRGARQATSRRRSNAPGTTSAGREPVARTAPERVAGIDLAERVLELAAERSLLVYFLGGAEGVAEEAARRQVKRFPGLQIVGTRHGYFTTSEEAQVVKAIRQSKAHILLVAMGAPRQELFLHQHRNDLGVPVGLGVGGSFDVWAGRVKRSPGWMRRAKVEWLYRLVSDPRRIRRQLALPRFAAQAIRWSPEDYGPARRKQALDGSVASGD
jgi:exopolysaccharide biosynthesis WecB/TagA/CpsF family protein